MLVANQGLQLCAIMVHGACAAWPCCYDLMGNRHGHERSGSILGSSSAQPAVALTGGGGQLARPEQSAAAAAVGCCCSHQQQRLVGAVVGLPHWWLPCFSLDTLGFAVVSAQGTVYCIVCHSWL
jgi:hypothetical protein